MNLEGKVEVKLGLFVDDLTTIIYTNTSEEGVAAAQAIIDSIYDFFKENNLMLNHDKTKILCVRSKFTPAPLERLKDPEGKEIEYVKDALILGIIWNEFNDLSSFIDHSLSKARRAFFLTQ